MRAWRASRSRCAGCRWRAASAPALSLEQVVEPVAEELQAEDGGEDGERRGGRGPEVALQEIVRARLHHVAPRRLRLLHAEAEIAQAGLDEDRLRHAERRLDHQQRAA